MNKWEREQLQRAIEAESYIKSPEYAAIVEEERKQQEEADIAAGHSPKCGLNKCHPECPSLKHPLTQ